MGVDMCPRIDAPLQRFAAAFTSPCMLSTSAGLAAKEPVFSPRSAFALGDASGTNCPGTGNMAKVTSAAACQSAAAIAAGLYADSVAASYMPGGCYWHTLSGEFYYNTNVGGGGNVFARPVCAGALDVYTP